MPTITVNDGPVAVTGASGYIGAHTVHCVFRAWLHRASVCHQRERTGKS